MTYSSGSRRGCHSACAVLHILSLCLRHARNGLIRPENYAPFISYLTSVASCAKFFGSTASFLASIGPLIILSHPFQQSVAEQNRHGQDMCTPLPRSLAPCAAYISTRAPKWLIHESSVPVTHDEEATGVGHERRPHYYTCRKRRRTGACRLKYGAEIDLRCIRGLLVDGRAGTEEIVLRSSRSALPLPPPNAACLSIFPSKEAKREQLPGRGLASFRQVGHCSVHALGAMGTSVARMPVWSYIAPTSLRN